MKKYSFLIAIAVLVFFSSCSKNNGLWGQMPIDEPSVFTSGVPKNNGTGLIKTPPVVLDLTTGPVWEFNSNANSWFVITGKWNYNTLGGHSANSMLIYINEIGRDGILRRGKAVVAAYDNQVIDEQAWVSSLFVPRTTRLAVPFPMGLIVNYYVDQYGKDRYTVR